VSNLDVRWEPSAALQDKLKNLSPRQRRAIVRIVQAEAAGIGLIRLLKTPYSCQWCGLRVGQSGDPRDQRKAALAEHETECEKSGTTWQFICRLTTYYRKWSKDSAFVDALDAARADVSSSAMRQAVLILQTGTPEAALELRRQVVDGEKDRDRRLASVALLDRAGLEPSAPASQAPAGSDVDFAKFQLDPEGFLEGCLHSRLTNRQIEIAEAVRDHQVTVVQSANGVGKTYVAGRIALWFLRSYRRSKVFAAAAPPLENLERLLWGEISRAISDHPDLFADVKDGHLHIEAGPDWYIDGVAIPSSGTATQREAKFSGKHAPYLLFILDEGDAIPDEVYRGIESCMSGGHARLLVLFNPREQSGPVYQLIKAGAHVIELDAFSHPNVATGRTVVPGAVEREVTVRRINEWSRPAVVTDDPGGFDHDPDWFQVPAFLDGATATREDGTEYPALIGGQWRKITNPALSYMVLARFPGQAENQLISRRWVEAAQQRWQLWQLKMGDRPPSGYRPTHGQDVAEMGQDSNVACFRYGGWVAPLIAWGGVDVLVTGDKAAQLAEERHAQESEVDATGVGSGVAPQMGRYWALSGYKDGVARAIKVAASPTTVVEEGEFHLLRDQLAWACREWLRTDPSAMLPPDEELADDLCAFHYRIRRGKIEVSDKDSLRRLLKRSPDKADALFLTFADGIPRYAPTAYSGRGE